MVDIHNGETSDGQTLDDPGTYVHDALFQKTLDEIGDTLKSNAKTDEQLKADFTRHCAAATQAAAEVLGLDKSKASVLINQSVSDGMGGWTDYVSRWYAQPTYDGEVIARSGEAEGTIAYADTWIQRID